METNVYKGFIQDWSGKKMLPITRAELVLDSKGNVALTSDEFLAKDGHPGLVTAAERQVIASLTSAGGALENIADVYNKLDYINEGIWSTIKEIYRYRDSVHGILASIAEDYKDTDFDV